jgi:hypothetical protein
MMKLGGWAVGSFLLYTPEFMRGLQLHFMAKESGETERGRIIDEWT